MNVRQPCRLWIKWSSWRNPTIEYYKKIFFLFFCTGWPISCIEYFGTDRKHRKDPEVAISWFRIFICVIKFYKMQIFMLFPTFSKQNLNSLIRRSISYKLDHFLSHNERHGCDQIRTEAHPVYISYKFTKSVFFRLISSKICHFCKNNGPTQLASCSVDNFFRE